MKILTCVAVSLIALASLHAQVPVSEEYLLMGDATRGAGEPMIAVDPTNPKNIVAVAMGNLQQIGGKPATGNMTDAFHAVANSTVTWLAVTHDGGSSWKVGELPILTGKFTRCPDSFVSVTAKGTFLAGCEPRETTGDFYGTSTLVISTDKGDTWSKPVDLISSYGAQKFALSLRPRIGGNSPWDRPFLYIDDSTGVIYAQAGGGETDIDTEAGRFRTQGYITASTDQGKSFGTIYAWDSKDYPQSGRGRMTAGPGYVAVTYTARAVPAGENATCPCSVFGLSRDQGKTFSYRVMKLPAMAQSVPSPAAPPAGRGRGGPGGGTSGFASDPTQPERFAVLMGSGSELRVSLSEDFGVTLSPFALAGQTPNARTLSKPWMEYSAKGVLALMWRAIHQDGTYDIWSSLSRDGGRSFSASLRVSHADSPASIPTRNAGLFGDDLQDVAIDDTSLYMVWADSRAGFQGVWFGRVPITAY
jgi:hypothetical protein